MSRSSATNPGENADGPFADRSGQDALDPALKTSREKQSPLPTSKAQCKNGGWKNFGTTFKNQGDCVSFVASGGKNPPRGP